MHRTLSALYSQLCDAWDFCELPLSLDMMSMGASSPASAVIPWDLVYLAGSESRYAPRPFALHLICYLALATRETESWMNGNDSIERPGPLFHLPAIYISFVPSQAANRIARHTEYAPPGTSHSFFTRHQDRIAIVIALLHNVTHPVTQGRCTTQVFTPSSPPLLLSNICYPRWDEISSRG